MPPDTNPDTRFFDLACVHVIRFGQTYNGDTIDDIGCTDRGLKWLDWVRGEKPRACDSETMDYIVAYLEWPSIKAELERLIG